MKRSCSFIKQLKSANRIATIGELKEIHYLLHDLNTPLDVISSKLQPFDKQNLSDQTKFNIDGVGEPFNLIYCAPPKSGKTSWNRGIVVLKDFIEGKFHEPEHYNPREVSSQIYNRQPKFKNVNNLTQIGVTRNPFSRLYSAWKDKSRTFRFKNGTIGRNITINHKINIKYHKLKTRNNPVRACLCKMLELLNFLERLEKSS